MSFRSEFAASGSKCWRFFMDTATRTFGNVEADSKASQLPVVVVQLTDATFECTEIADDGATDFTEKSLFVLSVHQNGAYSSRGQDSLRARQMSRKTHGEGKTVL